MDDLLQQGITAFRAGRREEARKIFATVVKQYPENERAWGWMYNVSSNDKEREYCLKQMLRINPKNEKANQLLNQLLAPPFTSETPLSSTPSPTPVSPSLKKINSSDVALNKNAPVGNKSAPKIIRKIQAPNIKKPSKNLWVLRIILGVGAVGLICVLAFGILFSNQPLVATNSTPTPTASPTAAPTGKWQVSTSKSELDDSTTVVLSLDAENYIQGWLDKALPKLVLRCKEKEINVFVNLGTQPEVEYGLSDAATVRVRFDQNQAFKMIADESTKGDALFFQNPLDMIGFMLQSKEMVFEFTPFNANPVVTTFDLHGLDNAIKPLNQNCN